MGGSLDNIKKHDISKTLDYALNKKLADMPGWTWVKSFVEADEKLHDMKGLITKNLVLTLVDNITQDYA